ncbi:thiamine phosphate synthase [Fluoribacter dumoffii]|uniref:thiamine phosphate synthase n=1 Tax=Fluoribacter dumoffii TaxID=463 RepID=UPI002243FF13|nr:thiamine phosphate synthase [Fluoribacter dumoffii]MCW8384969.1 thiamine phosphate synthase [Fluoribacter dumoffii]
MSASVWINTEKEADVCTLRALNLQVHPQHVNYSCQPHAIKMEGVVSPEELNLLKHYTGPVVLDFTLSSLQHIDKANLLSAGRFFADILILNTLEAESLLSRSIATPHAMEEAAHELLTLGAKSVVLCGEPHLLGRAWTHEYWTNGVTSFWLSQKSVPQARYPDLRTVFTSAITGALAQGYTVEDALILGKMYVHQAVRQAQSSLFFGGFPEDEADLPYLSSTPLYHAPHPFRRCPPLGLYPVVDRFAWVEMLLKLDVKTIQLRIKEKSAALEVEMQRSIALAKKYRATLFINDYWELALKLNAEAVHLGQSDLDSADLDAIRKQGLLLGVSTHCYYEVARAHAICPSYIAIGPVFETDSKEMPFAAQGVERLQRWQRTLNYPLVAIGGINKARMPAVAATGVQGVALISAITKAEDPQQATLELLSLMGK